MAKATRIINKYHIKEMLLNGNPQFENFYKEELIQFCVVSRELIQELKKQIETLEKSNKQLISKLDRYDAIVDERDELKKQLEELKSTNKVLSEELKK